LSLRKPPTQNDKKNYQAIPPNDTTDPKGNTAPQKVGFVSNTIPSPQQNYYSNGSKKRTPGWEKAAVVVALGILCVNAWQSWETRKSAGAAKRSADTAKAALIVEHRPWVGPEHGPSITLKVSSDEIEPSTFLSIRNYGSSVALNMAYAMAAAPYFNPADIHVTVNQMCQNAEGAAKTQEHSPDETLGVTIFPGGTPRIGKAWFAFNTWPLKNTSSDRDIIVIGCLAYVDEFHATPINSPIHHTRFCFENWQPIRDVISAQRQGQPTATFLTCLFENNAD
jgi:hypothetical protein